MTSVWTTNFAKVPYFISSWRLHVWTEATDNASVNFVKYKGDYYVSTETNYMRRVDPQSLETKEKVSPCIKYKSLFWILMLTRSQRVKARKMTNC